MSADAGPSKKPRLTENLETVQNQLDILKKVRGKPFLSKAEKIDILFVYFSLYKTSLIEGVNSGPVKSVTKRLTFYEEAKGL